MLQIMDDFVSDYYIEVLFLIFRKISVLWTPLADSGGGGVMARCILYRPNIFL